jgi:hypothetical protein
MSLQPCAGLIGFPVTLNQYFYNKWDNGMVDPSDRKNTDKLTSAIDFSVAWAPKTTLSISVDDSPGKFYINGLDNLANNTTLTYGSLSPVKYLCQRHLSVIKIQHPYLSYDRAATNEVILVFRINSFEDKRQNPSLPDLIMICRPIVLTTATPNGTDFWSKVDKATLDKTQVTVDKFSLADNFTYDGITLMPMMTYESCIPTRLIGSTNETKEGSTRIRVHVIPQPLYIPSTSTGTGKCTAVTQFTAPVNNLAEIFGQTGYTKVQFTTGKTNDVYSYPSIPLVRSDSLTLFLATPPVSNWDGEGGVIQRLELLVPEAFLGQSIDNIIDAKKLASKNSKRLPYKCYTIDPLTDITDDQITIDPTTGLSLEDTMKQERLQAAGGDPALMAALLNQTPQQGLMPGDVQQIILIIFSTLGSISLFAYALYILRLWTNKDHHQEALHNSGYFGLALVVLIVVSLVFSPASSDTPHPNVK